MLPRRRPGPSTFCPTRAATSGTRAPCASAGSLKNCRFATPRGRPCWLCRPPCGATKRPRSANQIRADKASAPARRVGNSSGSLASAATDMTWADRLGARATCARGSGPPRPPGADRSARYRGSSPAVPPRRDAGCPPHQAFSDLVRLRAGTGAPRGLRAAVASERRGRRVRALAPRAARQISCSPVQRTMWLAEIWRGCVRPAACTSSFSAASVVW